MIGVVDFELQLLENRDLHKLGWSLNKQDANLAPEEVGHRGTAHGRTGVARVGFLDHFGRLSRIQAHFDHG